jgi:XTP/dITP diphosphohydrolase
VPYASSLARLLTIMDTLRVSCPWDQKQTIHTLRQQTLEEVYELLETITDSNWDGMREELGDMLLHLVFYSKIASEQDRFTFADVIEGVCNKLVQRHPHVYGTVKATTDGEVKKNWEQIKLAQGKTSLLSGVPTALPALIKALRLQEKTAQVGFQWTDIADVRAKVAEEMAELDEAVASANQSDIDNELGDLMFSLVNYARYLNIDPEAALERTNKKFISRFTAIEDAARSKGLSTASLTLEQMDEIWNQVKAAEKQ